jgi:YVTN family beta-propeller protein
MVGDLAYVANQGTNTVTVVNTKTGAVVGNPIVVGRAPTGVLANTDGSKVYVTNRTDGTVSVIRTSDNAVIGSVKVGTSPEFMALNDTGTRLYVTNYGSSTVSVIDTATNKLVDANPSTTTVDAIKVGAYPRGIAYTTVNGQARLYVVNRSGNSVSVIDANTYKLIDANPSTTTVDSIKVGSTPEMIAIRDGYAYVTNTGSNTVSVINTATNKVEGSAITVGSKPAGVTFSTDGSVLYVANGNDTVSVIDAKTRTVLNTIQIDTAPESNYHIAAVRSDGSLVVTDLADKAVRVLTLKRGNTAPVSIGNPTVGAPDSSTGAVPGSVAVKDWDGDTVTYSVPTQPSTGTVTVGPAGTWTFTPNAAARQQASQTPGMTASFTVVATDGLGGTTSVPVSNVPILYSGNRPPAAYAPASVGTPNAITGVVGLNVNVSDPDRDPLTYTVTTPPTSGTTEQPLPSQYPYFFYYTPTQAARDLALQTPGPDTDTFIVTVSDGKASIPYTVTVPIQPANRAPVASPTGPTVGAPNVANGTVGGTLNVTDPDGNPLNYTVISAPTNGGVAVGYNGSFAYTPTQQARQAAAGSGPKTDTFTIRVTDTQYSVDVPVTVPISPSSEAVTTTAATVGSGASGVVLSGNGAGVVNPNRAYVVNTVSNSVSVVDTTTNTVTATIGVGPSPLSLAITPDGSRVYVTNSADNTVSVINTTSKTVVATIQVPVQSTWNPEVGDIPNVVGDIVVSPTGDRAYVTATDGTVSVINTSTNTVVSTNSVGYYSDLKISADGRHLYGTHFGYYGSPSVTVLDVSPAGTVTYNSAVTVGPVWDLDAMQSEFTENTYNVVLSPDGRRMYVTYAATTVARGTGGHTSGMFISDSRGQNWLVTGGYTAVSVVDIDPVTGRGTEVSRISVPAGAQDVALSPDGRTLYVTSWDGLSVTMIDTSTKAVKGGFTTDVTRTTTTYRDLTFYGDGYFNRFVVVGADGTVYVTDYDDGKLYATTVGSTAM